MIRVLHDPPLDGATNMARDEALLARVGRCESPPTLRLYQWDPPTISLGYFQRYADYEALEPPAGTLAIVRRLTGGGAILHDLELTYSLTLPMDHPLVAKSPSELYEQVHDAIIACLDSVGIRSHRSGESDHPNPRSPIPFFCFERQHRYDVLTGRSKIAGSAQRRTANAILQHGSIILGNRYSQQATAAVPLPFDESIRLVRSALAPRLGARTGEVLQSGDWSALELAGAHELVAKYAGEAWTKRT